MRDNLRRPLVGALLVLTIVTVACGGSDDSAGTSTGASVPATAAATTTVAATTPPSTEPETTEQPTADSVASSAPSATIDPDEAAGEGLEWNAVYVGDECMCADGSEFEIWDRRGDPTRVVLYLEGGGACFSAETCSFTDGTYASSISIGQPPDGRGGLFDRSNAENPIAEHAMVYVPYCSGDTHLGDATTEYSPELTVEHNGYLNAMAGLDHLV